MCAEGFEKIFIRSRVAELDLVMRRELRSEMENCSVSLLYASYLARLNYEKSWKKAKNLGKILLSTKKSWPIKEKLGVLARSIGQDFSKKRGIKSRRFFLESLGPKKKDSFFGG